MKAKHTFNTVAADYERVRPVYPNALIQDIIEFSQINSNSRILEIGSGTGKATAPFAQREFTIDCVEHGANLCEIASQKFSGCKNVTIHCASFEDWESCPSKFDLALSATAFHFIPADIGYPKLAGLLKPKGAMALFWTVHVPSYSEVFTKMREVYRDVAPKLDDSTIDPYEWIHSQRNQIETTNLFDGVNVRTYSWTEDYDADRYIDLLSTHSKHGMLPEQTRRELFVGLRSAIDEFGGRLTKIHLAALFLAKKKDEAVLG